MNQRRPNAVNRDPIPDWPEVRLRRRPQARRFRRMGWRGEPTTSELKNPERNISMGAAYLSILENGPLAGIRSPR